MNTMARGYTLLKLMQNPKRQERWRILFRASNYSVIFGLLVSALVVSSFLLIRQNNSLKNKLLKKGPQYLTAGELVPALRGLDLNNRIITVPHRHGEKDTLYFVFSPSCGWCKINLPNWQAILDQASERYRIVAVSISREKTAEYVHEHGLSKTSVIIEPEPRDLLAYRLQLTPQTILVDSKGSVRKNWLGAFGSEERQDIERSLNVRLPDYYFNSTAKQISAGRKTN
ncbi:MAG TPA: hypothetical protein VE685_06925 [Thermoanaerobaculia bacterium]|nr:hypothetical protein [Thermoanaerobaculia bacterium]